MSEPFIGEIRPFGFNFAPRGWAKCDGQLLAISSNTALFSLLGTIYGGDGRTSFALPDLRSRSMMHAGNGPGLSPRVQGQKFGQESATLLQQNLPPHTHTVPDHTHTGSVIAQGSPATSSGPTNRMLGLTGQSPIYTDYDSAKAQGNLHPDSVEVGGGSTVTGATGAQVALSIMDPHLVVNVCIALVGIFPSRS